MNVLRRRTRSFGHGEPEPLNLQQANLSLVTLRGADLSRADFYDTVLEFADLRGANLEGANLWEAQLGKASLEGANLKGANLDSANLEAAHLEGANLEGANLEGAAHLTQAQLDKTVGDKNTVLPSRLKPPAHWGVKADEQPEEN